MTNIGIQRKRSRSIENENEFFPLSKRINNLDIKFSQIIINNNNNQQHFKDLHTEQLQAQQIMQQQQQMHQYNPELSREENPHYFLKNNILYDLYIERLRRSENKGFDIMQIGRKIIRIFICKNQEEEENYVHNTSSYLHNTEL